MRNLSPLLGCALTALSLLALPGCGPSDSGDTARSESLTYAQELGSGELEFRTVSVRVPNWLLRVSRQGSVVSGHVVLHLEGGGTSDATPGNVTGSIVGGKVTLLIEPPAASLPGPAQRFEGVVVGDTVVGTLDDGAHLEPMKLESLAPGATDEHGAPLLATTRHEATVGDCRVDVTSAEFFALSNDVLEQRLNDLFAGVVVGATKMCGVGGAPAAVTGGGRVTLLSNDLVSVASVFTVIRNEDHVQVRAPERHSFDLRSGQELALFGDVLATGSEAKLGTALDSVVDAIRSDVLDAGERTELKKLLRAALADGRIATRYGLTESAIILDAPEFDHPHVTGVSVPYAAIADVLRIRSSL